LAKLQMAAVPATSRMALELIHGLSHRRPQFGRVTDQSDDDAR
jgi:hypothetical protein